MQHRKNILLTGMPGSGKTTVIKKLADLLGQKAGGFYTAELRSNNRRQGFEIVAIEHERRALLAHVDISSGHRVGKYGVNPEALLEFLRRINLLLQNKEKAAEKYLLLDEIGKMEFFTPGFKETVLAALDSPLPVIATIMFKKHPFCNRLKRRPDVHLVEVTRENRDELPKRIFEQFCSDHS